MLFSKSTATLFGLQCFNQKLKNITSKLKFKQHREFSWPSKNVSQHEFPSIYTSVFPAIRVYTSLTAHSHICQSQSNTESYFLNSPNNTTTNHKFCRQMKFIKQFMLLSRSSLYNPLCPAWLQVEKQSILTAVGRVHLLGNPNITQRSHRLFHLEKKASIKLVFHPKKKKSLISYISPLEGLELFYTHKHSPVRSDIKIKTQLCNCKQHLRVRKQMGQMLAQELYKKARIA